MCVWVNIYMYICEILSKVPKPYSKTNKTLVYRVNVFTQIGGDEIKNSEGGGRSKNRRGYWWIVWFELNSFFVCFVVVGKGE